MEIELKGDVPLFVHLAEVASAAQERDLTLHLVGGAAMILWAGSLGTRREMTKDLDWALVSDGLGNERRTIELAQELLGLMAVLGFERPEGWRQSRSGRFQFVHADDPIAVEFLCGSPSVGRQSRRPPAWELAKLDGGPPHFYAARTPWIEFIGEWVEVRVLVGSRDALVSIPDLPSLALLKLKAVRDKQGRIDAERDSGRLEYEENRLRRHGHDLADLVSWCRRDGSFALLARRVGELDEIGRTALEADKWFGRRSEIVERLELEGVVRAGRELAFAAGRSGDSE
ncbi:hypothetical protein [Engelhardtia mirabilis]|uniref:Nucleotidyl transferase AbiEii toxin, Type IV TA system n=1 Tax=Engelhardtia mirabilis TaxID=2528011 RepID=A0A518BEA0_9BACT|nr:hypothetical protein Pla133_03660 [Planctomycetes bacterium Pla133]QDU99627.1 hypothetical protein Pla86_03660 [Planctomycetes bacterium Pla86]